jgi:hypothetical protein
LYIFVLKTYYTGGASDGVWHLYSDLP